MVVRVDIIVDFSLNERDGPHVVLSDPLPRTLQSEDLVIR